MSNPQHSSVTNEHYTPTEVVEAGRVTMGSIDLDPASCEQANTLIVKASRFHYCDGWDEKGYRGDPGHDKTWKGNTLLNPAGGLVDRDFRPVYPKTSKRESCAVSGACGLPPGPGHKHIGVTSSARAWWFKMAHEFDRNHIEAGIFVGFSLEILQATQSDSDGAATYRLPIDFPFCVPRQRLRFLQIRNGLIVKGESPTHGNIIVGLLREMDQWGRFREQFSKIGKTRL